LLNDGRVLVAGGFNYASDANPPLHTLDSAEVYDPASNAWTTTGSLQHDRANATVSLLQDGRVLVAGGQGRPTPTSEIDDAPLATAEVYDPASEAWSAVPDMHEVRYSFVYSAPSFLLPSGKVLVTGGFGLGGLDSPLRSSELYQP
jgi:N-acetylneuraminic acid mutarotase